MPIKAPRYHLLAFSSISVVIVLYGHENAQGQTPDPQLSISLRSRIISRRYSLPSARRSRSGTRHSNVGTASHPALVHNLLQLLHQLTWIFRNISLVHEYSPSKIKLSSKRIIWVSKPRPTKYCPVWFSSQGTWVEVFRYRAVVSRYRAPLSEIS
jgi:hypothetical protein